MSNVQFDEQFNPDKNLPIKKDKPTAYGELRKTGFLTRSLYTDLIYGVLAIIFFVYAFRIFFSTTFIVFGGPEDTTPIVDQNGYSLQLE